MEISETSYSDAKREDMGATISTKMLQVNHMTTFPCDTAVKKGSEVRGSENILTQNNTSLRHWGQMRDMQLGFLQCF